MSNIHRAACSVLCNTTLHKTNIVQVYKEQHVQACNFVVEQLITDTSNSRQREEDGYIQQRTHTHQESKQGCAGEHSPPVLRNGNHTDAFVRQDKTADSSDACAREAEGLHIEGGTEVQSH